MALVAASLCLLADHAWAQQTLRATPDAAAVRSRAEKATRLNARAQSDSRLNDSPPRPLDRLRGTLSSDETTAALPPNGLDRPPSPAGEGLFGSVELPVRSLNVSARWKTILDDDPAAFFLTCREGAACRTALHRAFEDVRGRHREGLLSLELLRDVNVAVNGALRWQTDQALWGTDDYWAEPGESAGKGAGDCEDFAIAKFGLLAALGVPRADMRIAVVKDTLRGIGHAVLAVRAGEVSWILDNQAADVRSDRAISAYMPLYSVSVTGAWVHGVRRGVPVAGLQPVTLSPAGSTASPPALRPTLDAARP